MKLKPRIACAALLAATALPAMALQLGDIQVKSALDQPLVAAIPLHPKNLTELDGLSVGLASAADFQRAGLPLTPTDQTLRFHVVTDNNGQKLILVTSSQPVTDPYLDFLVQVNTRQGKQVREFVVLLNPVIAAPAPAVQAAPVASSPTTSSAAQPAELPAPSQFPQPETSAAPQSALPPPPKVAAPQPPAYLPTKLDVHHGDTLYGIASQITHGSNVSINQMMLALQAANPEAFFKDNIDDLKAGAILRIPTRELIDQHSVRAAAAEVHRQYEAWRAAKPHPATVVEGAAAQAAANAAPKPGKAPPSSDHLTLVPPTGEAGGANNRPGVKGGTGTATVTGLRQQLQADRDTLVSLDQSNSDLESRVHSLEDISAKTGKLLSLKDATIAELQRKLATVQSGTAAATTAGSAAKAPAAKPAASAQATKSPSAHTGAPWYMRPVTWIIVALIVLALIVLGLFSRRRGAPSGDVVRGPLADPDDVSPQAGEGVALSEEIDATVAHDGEASTQEHEPEAGTTVEPHHDPYGLAALYRPQDGHTASAPAHVESEPGAPAAEPAIEPVADSTGAELTYSDDPVDTKLDLARAYLDMGDPVGARAMLEEVLEEGTQMQKDEAKRLLADAAD
ncbi:MAG: type IV pilus assembly protein FimV [Rhodanobacteraceae bacterium]